MGHLRKDFYFKIKEIDQKTTKHMRQNIKENEITK